MNYLEDNSQVGIVEAVGVDYCLEEGIQRIRCNLQRIPVLKETLTENKDFREGVTR